MNILIIICLLLLVLSITDFVLPQQQKMHERLYLFAFFLTFFLFSIKYFYGADMLWYYNIYKELPTIGEILQGEEVNSIFEGGFTAFCVLCKTFHLSYWWMTFIVNVIYFIAIYKLFKLIPKKRIFALFLLVVLDYNLIFATHRQCMAVSFFIFMFLAQCQHKNFSAFIYLCLSIIMHKSAIFVAPVVFLLSLMKVHFKRIDFLILIGLLLILIFFPINYIILQLADLFSFPDQLVTSILYHIGTSNYVQVIFILYVLFLSIFIFYHPKDQRLIKMQPYLWVGGLLIALFYQYYPILWRLRSFFLPFFIVFTWIVLFAQNGKEELWDSYIDKKSRQFLVLFSTLFIYVFSMASIYRSYIDQNKLESGIYDTCTIFDLCHDSAENIQKRQIEKAWAYWEKENQKF